MEVKKRQVIQMSCDNDHGESLVKSVIGAEALHFIPFDTFDGSYQERQIADLFLHSNHRQQPSNRRDFCGCHCRRGGRNQFAGASESDSGNALEECSDRAALKLRKWSTAGQKPNVKAIQIFEQNDDDQDSAPSASGKKRPTDESSDRVNGSGKKSRITIQSRLRERAKACLLAAGWKIELKPRLSRVGYKDSIYVAPWGSSFWSLPKAWSAMREHLKHDNNADGLDPKANALSDKMPEYEFDDQLPVRALKDKNSSKRKSDISTCDEKSPGNSCSSSSRRADYKSTSAQAYGDCDGGSCMGNKLLCSADESHANARLSKENLGSPLDHFSIDLVETKPCLADDIDRIHQELFNSGGQSSRHHYLQRVLMHSNMKQKGKTNFLQSHKWIKKTGKSKCASNNYQMAFLFNKQNRKMGFKTQKKKKNIAHNGSRTGTCQMLSDDDNVTLASMIKNRKHSLQFLRSSQGFVYKKECSKNKNNIAFTKNKNNLRKGFVLSARSASKMDANLRGLKGSAVLKKHTVISWLIDVGIVTDKEPIRYLDDTSNNVLKEGWISRVGIICKCCTKVFSAVGFNEHAGANFSMSFSRLILQSGKSLTECQIEAWDSEYKQRKGGMRVVDTDGIDKNDDTCEFCGDGGDLICCDNCPSTFHQACLGIENIPEGNWYCSNCICSICGTFSCDEKSRVSTLSSCTQCEHKYHETCLYNLNISDGASRMTNIAFCGEDCEKVFSGISQFLGSAYPTGELSWMLLRSFDKDLKNSSYGIETVAECNAKLAVALAIMQECFKPMLDPRTGIDMIPHVIYSWGSNFRRLNYQHFCTMVLQKDDEIVSVASIRIHGRKFAEVPLIGTSQQYRRQGMCRCLMKAMEEMLMLLGVEKLVLSALPDLIETWTTAFGFKPLENSDREDMKGRSIMTFPGTTLLYKSIVNPEIKNLT